MSNVLSSFKAVAQSRNFIELKSSESCLIDLKYSTLDNFTKLNLYENFNRAYLHKVAYLKFEKAMILLKSKTQGYKFLVFDAFRPKAVQKIMFEFVKGTEHESYVANPERGSLHNFGLAIDLTIVDDKGVPLDMGTPFDDFDSLAQPRLESEFLSSGKLTDQAYQNRALLKSIMDAAGFVQLPWEWWHFDADKRENLSLYQIY